MTTPVARDAIAAAGKTAVLMGDDALAEGLRNLWRAAGSQLVTPSDVDAVARAAGRASDWWRGTPTGDALDRLRGVLGGTRPAAAPAASVAATPVAVPPARPALPDFDLRLAGDRLTEEQRAVLQFAASGVGILAVQAGAGAGKTSTLKALAAAAVGRRGVYTTFTKSMVVDARAKMPRNVRCSTAHSLAFRVTGVQYEGRLNGSKMRAAEVARRLGIRALRLDLPTGPKMLQPSYLANVVQRAVKNFCQSADAAPTAEHVEYIDGIDPIAAGGRRTWTHNRTVRAHVAPYLTRLWKDLQDPAGVFPFNPSHYFKLWQLRPDVDGRPGPFIDADFILVDEAQDLSPVLLDAVLRNRGHAQLIFVGDSQQSIFGFTGAVDALAQVPADATAFLTRSFRFGSEIAGVANWVLEQLDAELRITGAGPAGRVGPVARPDAVLCRTNAAAVATVLTAQQDGRPVWLVGGGGDVVRFAEAAIQLREEGWTSHPELAAFTSWAMVQDFVDNDEDGSDLKRLVNLIDEYTPETILTALGSMSTTQPDSDGDYLVVSTAHKSKGLEWDTVQLADDFRTDDPTPDDWRLLYVAATRARRHLDITRVAALRDAQGGRHLVAVA